MTEKLFDTFCFSNTGETVEEVLSGQEEDDADSRSSLSARPGGKDSETEDS